MTRCIKEKLEDIVTFERDSSTADLIRLTKVTRKHPLQKKP